jgi:hypothetical protein
MWSLIEKTVQVRRGPAAVTEENVRAPLSAGWEGRTVPFIQKPEDLPAEIVCCRPRGMGPPHL